MSQIGKNHQQSFCELVTISDEMKVNMILKGLASGLNQETYLNKLKAYVGSSEEHAIHFTNMLKKAMMANSPIVCILMGRIIADHIEHEKQYDRIDTIVVHALESATDSDLLQLYKMVDCSENGYIYDLEEYADCIEWCISTRLCKEDSYEKDDGTQYWSDCVVLRDSAYRLKEYLDEIKQVFRTGV